MQFENNFYQSNIGIILPVVLIFLLILALLTNTILSVVHIQHYATRNFTEKAIAFYAADSCIREIEKQLTGNSTFTCLLDQSTSNPWQSKDYCATVNNNIEIHYIIEPLLNMNANCISLNSPADIVSGKAIFYRITAWPAKDDNHLIIQSTFAKNSSQSCDEKMTRIKPGQMSWRSF